MDNRLKHALGDRPNSEFILDPEGKIARKRDWSHPGQVRKDLEKLVGPVEKITREEDVKLKIHETLKPPAPRGVVQRIARDRMAAIEIEPMIDPKGPPFYAKLRAEADAALLKSGSGKLYLGFHLDPFQQAHWNNLTPPLRYLLTLPKEVKIAKASGQAARVEAASDSDPREFLLDVEAWPAGKPIRLEVTYSACVGTSCQEVRQEYVLRLARDRDGGAARGAGAGFWDGEAFARRMLDRDQNGDGKLDEREVMGLVRPHFKHFDADGDGLLTVEELKAVAEWLNKHHAPGAPDRKTTDR